MQLAINLFLALVWMFLHTSYTVVTFLVGFVLGALIIFLVDLILGHRRVSAPREHKRFYLLRMLIALKLFFIFLGEMAMACFQVLLLVLRPQLNMRPGIIRVDIYLDSPMQISLLSNMITLTPGTLTMEIEQDNSALFIHVLNIADTEAIKTRIKRKFEKNIWEVFH